MAKKLSTSEMIEIGLKGVASQIPIVSGASQMYSDWKNIQQLNYIKSVLDIHGRALSELGELVNITFLNSEEYAFTLHKTILKAKNEIRENKRLLFADFLTKSCLTQNQESQDRFIYLELIDKIEFEHIEVLQLMDGITEPNKNGWAIDNDEFKKSRFSSERIRFVTQYFQSLALIIEFDNFRIDESGQLLKEDRYYVSALGTGLLEFLQIKSISE